MLSDDDPGFIFKEMSSKRNPRKTTFRIDLQLLRKKHQKGLLKPQEQYVDSNRNVAFCEQQLQDSQLSNALKKLNEAKNNKSEMKSTDEIQRSKTYKKQAEYFEKLKEWDKAEYFYKKAVDWSLKTDILMIPLSRTLFNCGKYDESLMYTEGILEVEPNHLGALILKADCLYQQSRFEYALMYYKRAERMSTTKNCKFTDRIKLCKKTIARKLGGK